MASQYLLEADWAGDDLPCLTIAPEPFGSELPPVLLLHGLGGRKENQLMAGYSFARAGFRGVAFDLAMHGERERAEDRERLLQGDYAAAMFEIVAQSVRDVSRVIDWLGVDSIALHAVSLGGIVAFAAMLGEPRISTASIAMGTPDWLGMLEPHGVIEGHPLYPLASSLSPLELAHKIPPSALLMLHGDEDDVIPISGVRKLQSRLQESYRETPERLDLVVYREHGHKYTDDMLKRSIAWTQKFH
ncbi:hypothetical protein CCAX7_38190 [Capsulimonas corticalis]|uniref:Uncharacterized protein n=1 Tax=Capsulimonas corticalis TaxID=2219043 RepID=A0A402D0T9_9BACT|nr:alpha/beta fold hydrolase [Capsulimonas corticalis]BDI31768.1 hypothetical protein CCAX7_38190 [Capsulimonas corticalis]